MADQASPADDHPWRRPPRAVLLPIRLAYSTWVEDNYDRMELEAFVEKRS